MTKYSPIVVISLITTVLILDPNVLTAQVSGQPLVGTNSQSKTSTITPIKDLSNNTSNAITLHTTNTIQTRNISLLNEELPVLKRATAAAVNYAILVARGNPTSNSTVDVNTKIINQLANNRVDTTQGIDFTKKLIATELTNAIDAMMAPTNNTIANIAHNTPPRQQQAQVVVDNQATCNNIASVNAACSFDITIRN